MKGYAPPIHRIDLSLPPGERYVELATIYRDDMRSLVGLFDDLIGSMYPQVSLKMVHHLARLLLRRVYSEEETNELRGISRVTGIAMYLLVAFNVLLDLLMGCTSGGGRIEDETGRRMLHFRTLDWGMDPLRKLVVRLEFVKLHESNEVLARSITYAGFVGVLTGVRKDLSVSLNFRPVHDTRKNFRFYFNHMLVLLGQRQSISSLLRQCILPREPSRRTPRLWFWRARHKRSDQGSRVAQSLPDITENIPSLPTTAAYLIFCDGATTVTMEKDYRSAILRSSSSFIVVTNHDQGPDSTPTEDVADEKSLLHTGLTVVAGEMQSMVDLIEDSNERRECMQSKWDQKVRRTKRAYDRAREGSQNDDRGSTSLRRTTRTSSRLKKTGDTELKMPCDGTLGSSATSAQKPDVCASQLEIFKWLTTYPVVNESTHYAAVMDPTLGEIVWVRRYLSLY